MIDYIEECENIAHTEHLRLEAETERLDGLLSGIKVPCQHCFDSDIIFDNDGRGGVSIVCETCGCSTGVCDTHEEAVARWTGRQETKISSGTRDEAWERLHDLYSEKYKDMTRAESDIVSHVLAQIWNNEVPGIRFECGGANNRVKK